MNLNAIKIGAIRQNVEMPGPTWTRHQGPIFRAIREMQVGDCRDIDYPPDTTYKQFQRYVLQTARACKVPVATRKKEDGSGLTVWRIAEFQGKRGYSRSRFTMQTTN